MGCNRCGAPTSRRVCRDCELALDAEEQAASQRETEEGDA